MFRKAFTTTIADVIQYDWKDDVWQSYHFLVTTQTEYIDFQCGSIWRDTTTFDNQGISFME